MGPAAGGAPIIGSAPGTPGSRVPSIKRAIPLLLVAALAVGACGGSGGEDGSGDRASATTTTTDAASADCADVGTRGATAGCLEPTQAPQYYVDQALAYFDTLDVDADPENVPNYAEDVARWEWPPWLLLTGFGRDTMITTSNLLRSGDPSTVPERDCRFFETQPFARCYVQFQYERGPCPIYEEFAFDDAGQMTFIEAWSDLDGLRPTAPDDPWAEGPDFDRLSTRVPGLGSEQGLVGLASPSMRAAAAEDDDVADFALRATDQWRYWGEALAASDGDYFATGCGWS